LFSYTHMKILYIVKTQDPQERSICALENTVIQNMLLQVLFKVQEKL